MEKNTDGLDINLNKGQERLTGNIVEEIYNDKSLPLILRKELKEVYENVINLGRRICFEISPRNVKVDDNGNLILLDVFYDREILLKNKK